MAKFLLAKLQNANATKFRSKIPDPKMINSCVLKCAKITKNRKKRLERVTANAKTRYSPGLDPRS